MSERAEDPAPSEASRGDQPFAAQRARAGSVAAALRDAARQKGWDHPDTQALWAELHRLIDLVDGRRQTEDEMSVPGPSRKPGGAPR